MEHNALAREFTASSLLRFALPNIAMMVFLSLYTIVDGMFISRYVGTLALSAINMSYPLNSLEMAVGIMLATGGSAIIARKQGEGRGQEAREDFTCIVAASLAVGGAFAVLGNLFLSPILHLLGTSAVQWPYCEGYTRILLGFAPAFFLQTAFQSLFVTAGRPGLGLGTTVAGGLVNVVLDWLFMGPMGMGVEGAAVATVLGYCVPAVAGAVFFFRGRNSSLRFVAFRPRWRMLAQACGNGSSEMVSNVANAVTTFLFNMIFLAYWGEDGVASITIAMYFQFVFTAVFFGFSLGVAPVISYQYGAQNTEQLRKIVRICLGFVAAASLGAWLVSRLVIGPSLALFTEPDSGVYAVTIQGFPIYALSFLLMGTNIFASALFTAFSDGAVSAVISVTRTFLFLVGMLLVLPRVLGETGIWLAVPAAELLGLAVSAGFLLWGRKKYEY
ncbi:MATE family efflux transporter [uncultured Oscillibacter sp.]|uniref:MATE family efflux transporter n=1 Tax=uncultured Oscillibacter sp. TaxID=876091 RepID=UPI0025F27DFA|nr:MATE family efflux transporter [uncultured Oscillibacter sp.]